MATAKPYNFEKFSVYDIEEYLKSQNMNLKKENYQGEEMLNIENTNIYIDIPRISISGDIVAYIRFENYPKTKNHESDQKLFNTLKRKFSIKNESMPKKIKDEEKLEIKNYQKKGIWPFNKIF